jgi:hypothetical protein
MSRYYSSPPLTPEQEAANTASPERLQELVDHNGARVLRKAACNRAISRNMRLHIISKRCLTELLISFRNWQAITFVVTKSYLYDDGNYTDDSKSPYRDRDSLSITYYKFELEGTEDEESEIYEKLNKRLRMRNCEYKLCPNLDDMSCEYIGHQNNKEVATLRDIIISFFILLISFLIFFGGGYFWISSIKNFYYSFYPTFVNPFIALFQIFGIPLFIISLITGLEVILKERLYKRLIVPSIFLFIKLLQLVLNLSRLVVLVMLN